MTRRRLDAELVRRGLARSRTHAATLVRDGRITVAGAVAAKPATQVEPAVAIVLLTPSEHPDFVSRGGFKLQGALDAFEPRGLDVAGRRCLDAGASTGGFTDVLLRRGAAAVVAVDVGYGQLAWALQQDERVQVMDRTNVRTLSPDQVAEPVSLVVADLSFISLSLVLPSLVSVSTPDADLVLMVKPQFEVGKDDLGEGGVVREPTLRAGAVRKVAQHGGDLGLGVKGVTASPLPGPAGNVEYFLWFRRGAPRLVETDLERAIAEGPA